MHVDLTAARISRAVELQRAGRVTEALVIKEELLAEATTELGPRHPDTLLRLANVATAYQLLGRDSEALELKETVLRGQLDVLDPEIPSSYFLRTTSPTRTWSTVASTTRPPL